ncbi:hypothetical protein KIH87_09390 [Paraneptunicella aestuarii]|uniref:hypothetical protein n=1 Tax=Paraneptunicella aestuarii TaxID=2831148 RepID=UPI001E5F255F|nr:hypothetical protein [Paraneptunicella aestuarii]UAA40526.1 hypothetical protein KIH87_09390 [Paraneptunicella aestuarii]
MLGEAASGSLSCDSESVLEFYDALSFPVVLLDFLESKYRSAEIDILQNDNFFSKDSVQEHVERFINDPGKKCLVIVQSDTGSSIEVVIETSNHFPLIYSQGTIKQTNKAGLSQFSRIKILQKGCFGLIDSQSVSVYCQPMIVTDSGRISGFNINLSSFFPEIGFQSIKHVAGEQQSLLVSDETYFESVAAILETVAPICKIHSDIVLNFHIASFVELSFLNKLREVLIQSGIVNNMVCLSFATDCLCCDDKQFNLLLTYGNNLGFSIIFDGKNDHLLALDSLSEIDAGYVCKEVYSIQELNEHAGEIDSEVWQTLQKINASILRYGQFQEDIRTLENIKIKDDVLTFALYQPLDLLQLTEFSAEYVYIGQSTRVLTQKLQSLQPHIYFIGNDKSNHLVHQLKRDLPVVHCFKSTDEINEHLFLVDVIIADSDIGIAELRALLECCSSVRGIVLVNSVDVLSKSHQYDPYLMDSFDANGEYRLFLPKLIRKIERNRELANSNKIAQESMKQAYQYGSIIEFCKQIFQLESADELLVKTTQFFEQHFKLKCAAMLAGYDQQHYHYSGQKECPETVVKVLNLVRGRERVYHYQSNRLVFNDSSVSILVLNAPKDEYELGQIKDLGAVVVTIVAEKWRECIEKQALRNVSSGLHGLSHDIQSFTRLLMSKRNEALKSFTRSIHDSFHLMDFTVDQEEFLIELAGKMIKSLNFKDELEEIRTSVRDVQSYTRAC